MSSLDLTAIYIPAKFLFVAAVIGFVNQSYTTTEGEDEFNISIGVMSSTQLGREVVVVLTCGVAI